MSDKINSSIQKVMSTRIWYYIENTLVVGLLFYCIKSLIDYDNAYYQVWKNEAGARAILAFTVIIFILRKVRLINWQSLVATLLFCIFVIERMHFWAEATDILLVVKYQMATEWLTLMIIIDMILYKEINNIFFKFNAIIFLYVVTAFGMIWRRNGLNDPIVLIFPFLLFAFIKLSEEKTKWFLYRFIDSWFIAFIYVCVRSFIENPYSGWRYYGYFVNIGPFGIFMSCCLVTSLVSFIILKEKGDRINFLHIISVLWILSCLTMLWIINTITSSIGIVLTLIIMYIFIRNDTERKTILKRFAIVSFLIILFAISSYLCLKSFSNSNSYDDLIIKGDSNRLIDPINNLIYRFYFSATDSIDPNAPLSQQMLTVLDNLSSGRITIAREYAKYFNYDGNGALSLNVFFWGTEYYAFNPHNQYINLIVEYGYLSFIEIVILILASFVSSIKKYLNSEKKAIWAIPSLWISNMLGVWLGEGTTFYYPVSFFGILFIVIMMNCHTKKEAT